MDRDTNDLRRTYKFDNKLFYNWMIFEAKKTAYAFNNGEYGVSISEYTAIATHLIRHVEPPREILDILNRIIALRKHVNTM